MSDDPRPALAMRELDRQVELYARRRAAHAYASIIAAAVEIQLIARNLPAIAGDLVGADELERQAMEACLRVGRFAS